MNLREKFKWLWGNLECDPYESEVRRDLLIGINSVSEGDSALRVNSIGTSLYIIGVINEERLVDPIIEYDVITKKLLMRAHRPVIGGIVSWEQEQNGGVPYFIKHMGVVTRVNPDKITHRDLETNRLIIDVPLGAVCNVLGPNTFYYMRETHVRNIHKR